MSSRPRSWGTRFDALPSSPLSSADTPLPSHADDKTPEQAKPPMPPAVQDGLLPQSKPRIPQEATIFVGSLPPEIDNQEISELLIHNLNRYGETFTVKVVRDSRRLPCAFVQCQDVKSASKLFEAIEADPPPPFMGRTPRFEKARAFRSLLLSYRAPTQAIRVPSKEEEHSEGPEKHTIVDIEPATDMAIYRQPGQRFYSMEYNYTTSSKEVLESLTRMQNVLYLSPLKYDEDTLRTIVSHFGPLEHFCSIQPVESDTVDLTSAYPHPHDGPRAPNMDISCWEVKWEHREDALGALASLRRVPHLTVTWARGPPPRSPDTPTRTQFPTIAPGFTEHTPSSISAEFQDSMSPEFSSPLSSKRKTLLWSDEECPALADASGRLGSEQTAMVDAIRNLSFNESSSAHSMPSSIVSPSGKASMSSPSRNFTRRDLAFAPRQASLSVKPGSDSIDASKLDGLYKFGTVGRRTGRDLLRQEQENRPIELDLFSIFVGGLDVWGIAQWTEEKLGQHFSRHGAIENVKLVMPKLPGRMGFAFIKFESLEGARRAVTEEHNRLVHGRYMRVQYLNRAEKQTFREHGRLDDKSKLEHESVGPLRVIGDINAADVSFSGQSPAILGTPRTMNVPPQVFEGQTQTSHSTLTIRHRPDMDDQALANQAPVMDYPAIEETPQNSFQIEVEAHGGDDSSLFDSSGRPSSPSPNASHSMRSPLINKIVPTFSNYVEEDIGANNVEGATISSTITRSSQSDESNIGVPSSPSADQRHRIGNYVREIPSAPSTPHTPSVYSSAPTSASGGQGPPGFPPPYPHYHGYSGPYIPYMYPAPYPGFSHGSHNVTPTSSTHSLQFSKNNGIQLGPSPMHPWTQVPPFMQYSTYVPAMGNADHPVPSVPHFVPAGFVQSPEGGLITVYQPNTMPQYAAEQQHMHAVGPPEYMGWRAGPLPPPPGYPMAQPAPHPSQPSDLQSNQGQVHAMPPMVPWASCPPSFNIALPSITSHSHPSAQSGIHDPPPFTPIKSHRGRGGGAHSYDGGREFQSGRMTIHGEGHKRPNTGFYRRGGRGGHQHGRHNAQRSFSTGSGGSFFDHMANHTPKH